MKEEDYFWRRYDSYYERYNFAARTLKYPDLSKKDIEDITPAVNNFLDKILDKFFDIDEK